MSVQPRRPTGKRSPPSGWLSFASALVCLFALWAPLTAGADSEARTFVSPDLLDAAQAEPLEEFKVIVQGSESSRAVAAEVGEVDAGAVDESFVTVDGVAAELAGSEIVELAQSADALVITSDSPLRAADDPIEPPVTPEPGPADVPASTEKPGLSGDAEAGGRLTATPGVWTGGGTLSYAYQWQHCAGGDPEQEYGPVCKDIFGATDESYGPTRLDVGLRVRVVVTASNEAGTAAAASELSETVLVRPPTVADPPAIIGTAEEGQTLIATNGVWGGSPPFMLTYQWERCDVDGESCHELAEATEAGYTLGAADAGATIRLAVVATGPGGRGVARSEPSAAVLSIPPLSAAFGQHWPYVAGVASFVASHTDFQPPTIAIVDSGVERGRNDFGGKLLEAVTVTSREPNSPGDGYGHGTAVASVAAGKANGYKGAAPRANLVSLDVLDDDGVANTTDVIAAADWIYKNKDRLNIRVANFSLHGTSLASLVSDPLDKAVERLWHSGIVVVTAAGNYAVDGEESAVPFAPGNDPFVITVGATDTGGTYMQRDDVMAPWSAWGYTRDGFAKPEVSAPGRYMAAAAPADSELSRRRPDRIIAPGYVQLSGTSLAAPVVAGIAANLLSVHPAWTPDQVKGALMLTAQPLPRTAPRSSGVGAVNLDEAAAVVDPPNPNLALNSFLVPDPEGGPTPIFDAASWTDTVQADPAWASVAWGSVAWGSAAWSSVAWGSVAWGSVAWGSVAWGSVAWGSVAWGSVAWGSDAEDDVRQDGPY